jgi:protein-disulfide isomerase
MQLVFRSLILLVAMMAYGQAEEAISEQTKPVAEQGDKVPSGEADKVASGNTGKTVTEQVDKIDAQQTAKNPAEQANKVARGEANKAPSGKEDKVKLVSKPLPEMGMGSSKAPVTIINYSSLTCGHCAQFHTAVLPKIEEKYIKPGYVRIIFRDFPGDQISINAHRLAWCKGEMKYLDFVKLLYSTQEKWLLAPDPVAALKSIALQNGITAEQFEACLKDQELLDKIIQLRLEGQKKYNITATPTIIINAKIYPRALTFEEFEEIVRPLLAPSLGKDKKKVKVMEEKKGKDEAPIKVSTEKKAEEKEKTE